MHSICLVTPSCAKDFRRCELLCESIDRHVTGYVKHYVVVDEEDIPLFKPLTSERRVVVPLSQFLPVWLNGSIRLNSKDHRSLNKFQRAVLPVWLDFSLRLNAINRRFKLPTLWRLGALPVSGWHIQQLVKLMAAANVAEQAAVHIDSDVVFVRPWNVSGWIGGRVPLYRAPEGICADTGQHVFWVATAHAALGLAPPQFPATDYICHIVAWYQPAVRTLLDRIERNLGQPWILALCRRQEFSECILYGCHVASDPAAEAQHRWVDYSSPCHSYWPAEEMNESGLKEFIAAIAANHVAICVQSNGRTSIDLIRKATGYAHETN